MALNINMRKRKKAIAHIIVATATERIQPGDIVAIEVFIDSFGGFETFMRKAKPSDTLIEKLITKPCKSTS